MSQREQLNTLLAVAIYNTFFTFSSGHGDHTTTGSRVRLHSCYAQKTGPNTPGVFLLLPFFSARAICDTRKNTSVSRDYNYISNVHFVSPMHYMCICAIRAPYDVYVRLVVLTVRGEYCVRAFRHQFFHMLIAVAF